MFVKPFSRLTLLLAGVAVAFCYLVVLVPSASALTVGQQKDCFRQFNDAEYNLDRQAGRDKLADFKKNNCYEGKGGNCDYVVPTAEAVARGAQNHALIGCTDPDKEAAGGGSTSSCKDGTKDKALCNACTSSGGETSQDCNLTKKYLNPFINKFLAPLAILSVIIGIIWGSITYATSAGDAQKAADGKSKIQKALIGLLAFIFLYAFLNWLIPGGLFGA